MVKSGFKQTEVGEIPEDWDTARLGEHGRTYGGLSGKSAADFGQGRAHYVPFLNVITNSLIRLDQLERVRVDPAEGQNAIQDGDLLFNGSSEVPEEVAMGCLVSGTSKEVFLNSFCFGYRPSATNPFDGRYLSYLFRSPAGRRVVSTLAQGSTRYNISKTALMRQELPLPPLPEQKRIAEVLSDTDELIESLERLIAKKQLVKLATMDDLLTGKRRLAGFGAEDDEWETTELGAIGEFGSGSGFPLVHQGRTEGEYPLFKVSDMNTPGNQVQMRRAANRIDEGVRSRLGARAFPAGSVIFAKVGAAVFLERKRLLVEPSCLDNNMACFVPGDRVDSTFVHHWLTRFPLSDLVATTALPSFNARQLRGIEISLPPLPEQQAIAKVLSDMDEDIEALQQRRDKTKRVKEALMDELLTGRTRV